MKLKPEYQSLFLNMNFMLQAGWSRVRFLMKSVGIFNWLNPSGHTIALGLDQPLTKICTRNLSGGKERPARKADNLTAICEPDI
jgi:hypothetical protein